METLQKDFIVWGLVLISLVLLTLFLVAPLYINHREKRKIIRHELKKPSGY